MKMGKALLTISSMFCLATAASALADEAPFATFHIQLEGNAAQSLVNPVLTSPITKGQIAFRINNNTGKQAYFVSGDNRYVPMVSENTFTVPYVPGEHYKVIDQEGKIIATWQLENAQSSTLISSTDSKSKYEDWSQRIQSVIQSNQPVAIAPYQQSTTEPAQAAPPASGEKNTVVRGYW